MIENQLPHQNPRADEYMKRYFAIEREHGPVKRAAKRRDKIVS